MLEYSLVLPLQYARSCLVADYYSQSDTWCYLCAENTESDLTENKKARLNYSIESNSDKRVHDLQNDLKTTVLTLVSPCTHTVWFDYTICMSDILDLDGSPLNSIIWRLKVLVLYYYERGWRVSMTKMRQRLITL